MNPSSVLAPPTSIARTVLRWTAGFVGFPLGGLAAELTFGPVDGLVPAVLGGGLTGAVLGLVQHLAVARADAPPALRWAPATAAGLAVGLAAGSAAVDYGTGTGALAVQGAICGLAVGFAQVMVLARRLGALVWAWPGVLSATWALGWVVTATIGVDVEAQYTVFGSSGAIVVAALTSILPLALRRRPEPVPRRH